MTDESQSDAVSASQHAFLDMLARGSQAAAETAPREPPPARAGTEPAGGAPESATDTDAPPAAPMVYVEPTVTWEDRARAPSDLMDLGADAQAQGHAMGLMSVANRLVAITNDLDALGYGEQAAAAHELGQTVFGEHDRLMRELEQRGRERRGEE